MSKTAKTQTFDIIIVGAGPVGLGFARSMADTGLQIALIEKHAQSVLADPPYDGREVALTHHSYDIMRHLGIWDLLPDEAISLIKDAKVLNGTSPYALHFDHEEAGRDNLGFMVSNQNIRKASFAAIEKQDNITLMTETIVTDAQTDHFQARVTLDNGNELTAKLLVAADSRFSPVRDMMGIETEKLDFKRLCVVCRLSHEKSHDKTAYECFHYDRTLAVLPLNNNHCSAVITLPAENGDDFLALDPETFAQDIAQRIDHRLGDMSLVSKLFPYPLMGTYAKRFYATRCALIGDAAVGMHPVTAHGFNLGLKGQDTLAKEIINAIETGGDIGSTWVLRRYDKAHRHATRPLYLGTNALVKLFTKTTPPAKALRKALLVLGNRIGPARRLIMGQLTDTEKDNAA